MPRKPTTYVRSVEVKLRAIIASTKSGKASPLPTVRALASQLDVSYATVSRLLARLAQESVIWQHPNGRSYPAAARKELARALPIVVLGRQIQHWSVLYREIIEGVSEVCSARGCPLVFLSSEKLLLHRSPEERPAFASKVVQQRDLTRLLSALPKPCGGILFDHLWDDALVAAASRNHPASMLLRSIGAPGCGSARVDLHAAADLVTRKLVEFQYKKVIVCVPFVGDRAIDDSREALDAALKVHAGELKSVEVVDCGTARQRTQLLARLRGIRARVALVSLEDNVTSLLWAEMESIGSQRQFRNVGLVSMQGTALLASPVARLRFDYKLLGREAVASMLSEPYPERVFRPVFIPGRTLEP